MRRGQEKGRRRNWTWWITTVIATVTECKVTMAIIICKKIPKSAGLANPDSKPWALRGCAAEGWSQADGRGFTLLSAALPGCCHSHSWRYFGRLCTTPAFQRTKATKCKAAVLYILLSTKHMVECPTCPVIMQLIKTLNICKYMLKIHMLLTSALPDLLKVPKVSCYAFHEQS